MKKTIKEILSSRNRDILAEKGLTPSAVLLLLVSKGEDYHILFTKRSLFVAHHKGEISFPGGTLDPDDVDLRHTALREGEEEIGVRPEDVELLGRLDDVATTTTGFHIATYVGVIPYPYPFKINHDEIAEVFIAPLNLLCVQYKTFASVKKRGRLDDGNDSFRYQGHVIWGATARILRQFLALVCDAGC